MPVTTTPPDHAPAGARVPATTSPDGPAHRLPDRLDRRLAKVVGGLLLVAVAVLLGRALLGQRALIATNQMLEYAPWAADVPTGFHGSTGPWGDTYDIWEPQRLLFAEELRDGQLGWWNPYPSGGAPLAAEPSTGTFGPFQLPYLLVPGWYAPGLVKLAELAVSAGFTFLFLRAAGTSRTAAVVGGAIYALNGFQLVWTNWPQTRVGALVPALLWAVERLVQRRSARTAGITALVVGAMLLEGFPAVTLVAMAAAGLYALVRCLADGHGRIAERAGQAVRPVLLAGVGVGLGVGLAAIQLLPFQQRLSSLGLHRDQTPASHLDPLAAATTVAPGIFGSAVEMQARLGDNYVEALSYVGAAAVALALVGLLSRRAGGGTAGTVRRGVRTCAAVAVLVLVVLMFFGGPLLALLQNLPPLDTNRVGRLRGLLAFFVAVLAGLGVEDMITRPRPARPAADGTGETGGTNGAGANGTTDGADAGAGAGWVARLRRRVRPDQAMIGGVLVVVAVAAAAGLYRWGRHVAYLRELAGHLGVAGLLGALTVGAVLLAWRRPATLGPAVVLVGVLVVGQGLVLWSSYLPESRRDEWFPRTAMHDFLAEHLGDDRVVPADGTLVAGSTSYYRLRTVTGHVFTQPTWKDLLATIDPAAFAGSPTDSVVGGQPEVVTSPVLDRMAARYFATAESAAVLGVVTEPVPSPGAAPVRLDAGETVTVPIGVAQRLRGVRLAPTGGAVTNDRLARLEVTVRQAGGTVVGTGARRANASLAANPTVAVDAETATTGGAGDLVAEVRLDADDGYVLLATGPDGQAAAGTVTGDDDLRLVFTDGGQVYERESALPRVRWASRAEVVEDPGARRQLLAAGVPADTVLLDAPPPDGAPATADRSGANGTDAAAGTDARAADVELVRDELSSQTIEVEAPEAGYVVVADAVQIGWEATVDGQPAELLHADHAMGAVAVPPGHHVVQLRFAPSTLRPGAVITLASAVAVVALLAMPAVTSRVRRRPR
jgi:membrane protein YfhO